MSVVASEGLPSLIALQVCIGLYRENAIAIESEARYQNGGTALNIKLLEPLAQGASRFEKSLAPPKIHWPPQKSTGPQFFQTKRSPIKTVVDIKTLK